MKTIEEIRAEQDDITRREDALVRAKVAQARIKERELNDIRRITATAEGRRFYWRVLTMARTFQNSFTGNESTYYNEGMRSIGTELFNDLFLAAPDDFLKMRREYLSDQSLINSTNERLNDT